MDGHKSKPIHGWRDLLKEVGIIVLGVLIALGAQQIVDDLQWRSKIAGAEAAMRDELQNDDGLQAYARLAIYGCVDGQLAALATALEAERDHGGPLPALPARWPSFLTWDDDAWRSAVASDVTGHMRADRMAKWAGPYVFMPVLTRENVKETEDAADLHTLAHAKAPLAPQERDRLFLAIERLRRDNAIIADGARYFLDHLHEDTGITLKPAAISDYLRDARARWGPCIQAPPVYEPNEKPYTAL